MGLDFLIEADGSMNAGVYAPLYEAGADMVVLGPPALWNKDPRLGKHGKSWKRKLKNFQENKTALLSGGALQKTAARDLKNNEKKGNITMENKSANIGARLDRLPNSGWHVKMWLISAFALLVCWSNGIGGAVQNILLNEIHWLVHFGYVGTTYTAGQLFGALVGGPIGDKIGRKRIHYMRSFILSQ